MRALVLSGGGAKGAWQVGAVLHLLGDLKIEYDLYCGISVGALNSSFLSMFDSGREIEAALRLKDVWTSIDNSHIYKSWKPFGRFSAFWKSSLYDSSPLVSLIDRTLDERRLASSGKQLRVGAVSIKTGEYRIWSEESPDIKKAVAASSSFPVYFCPIRIDDQFWTDGGVREITPLHTAINLGATQIDVLVTSPIGLSNFNDASVNVFGLIPRVIDTMSEEILENDLDVANLTNKLVLSGELSETKRYISINVLRPNKSLIRNSLDFDPAKIRENINRGYKDAVARSWV